MKLGLLILGTSAAIACMGETPDPQPKPVPFKISIVPESSQADRYGISWSDQSKRSFHVVLTNISNAPQHVFEDWNSWGYQAISFEWMTPDGKTGKATVKPQNFTRNAPSTYKIARGGHQVYTITLNHEWEGKPNFGGRGRSNLKLRAVYEISEDDDSKTRKVWAGRIESEQIEVEINHW